MYKGEIWCYLNPALKSLQKLQQGFFVIALISDLILQLDPINMDTNQKLSFLSLEKSRIWFFF